MEGARGAARRGWLPFLAAKPPPLCLPHRGRRCVEKTGILVSLPSPLGKGDRAAVDRVLSQAAHLRRSFPLVFHPARTLSSSLRSPPSPRGEGCVRRYSFSTYACIRFDDARKAVSSFRSLPHWGRGTASAVDRVLSLLAHLRRSSSLFFMPLEPYPARSARHLLHAGKALSVVILFLHVSRIRFGDARKAAFSYRCLPHWGRGIAPAVDRVLSYIVDLRRSPLSFSYR